MHIFFSPRVNIYYYTNTSALIKYTHTRRNLQREARYTIYLYTVTVTVQLPRRFGSLSPTTESRILYRARFIKFSKFLYDVNRLQPSQKFHRYRFLRYYNPREKYTL